MLARKGAALPPTHLALFLSGLAGGGAQRRLLILAHEFALRGYRVDVVAARSEGPFQRELSPLVRLVALDSLPSRGAALTGSKGLWVLASAPALARYLARERPDLVLSTSNPANLAALWARRWARVDIPGCISVNVHLSEAAGPARPAWGRWLRRLMQRWYPRADAAVAISQGVARDLAHLTGLPRERISPRAGDTGQAGQGRPACRNSGSGEADTGRTPCRDDLGAAPQAGFRDRHRDLSGLRRGDTDHRVH